MLTTSALLPLCVLQTMAAPLPNLLSCSPCLRLCPCVLYSVVDHPIRRLQLQRGSSLEYSSWCSTPSSMGSPSVRLASDAEAEYHISRWV